MPTSSRLTLFQLQLYGDCAFNSWNTKRCSLRLMHWLNANLKEITFRSRLFRSYIFIYGGKLFGTVLLEHLYSVILLFTSLVLELARTAYTAVWNKKPWYNTVKCASLTPYNEKLAQLSQRCDGRPVKCWKQSPAISVNMKFRRSHCVDNTRGVTQKSKKMKWRPITQVRGHHGRWLKRYRWIYGLEFHISVQYD